MVDEARRASQSEEGCSVVALRALATPRLREGCEVEAAQDRWVVRHPLARAPVVVSGPEREIVDLLDGGHRTEDLAVAWCRRSGTADVAPLLLLLCELQEAGLLEEGLDAAEVAAATLGRRVAALVVPRCRSGLIRDLLALSLIHI